MTGWGGGGWGLGGCSRYRIYVFGIDFNHFLSFFSIFLTKTSEQHKERLLVVVSFFVYFRSVLSLTESPGNEYN